MLFKRKKHRNEKTLCDFVEKTNETQYMFADIVNDIAEASENSADDWPPLTLMSFAYVRRAAVAALLIQGLVEKDSYEHVKVFFKGMQVKTGHTVEFQEQAFTDAIDFMTGYSQVITSFSVKKIVQIAEEYDIPSGKLSDAELFESVIDTAYNEEKLNEHNSNLKGASESDIIENSLSNNTREENQVTQDEIISKLQIMSDSNNVKTCTFDIVPMGVMWRWQFKFSDEERETADELTEMLYELRNGDFIICAYNILK